MLAETFHCEGDEFITVWALSCVLSYEDPGKRLTHLGQSNINEAQWWVSGQAHLFTGTAQTAEVVWKRQREMTG